VYPDAIPITESNVTAATFEQALQTSAPFCHFTGHGEHNAENPEDSALYLADDQPFTLKQLLNLDALNFPLVCLAACETGIANQGEFINEFVGFPAAFLAQGSRYILSTLWTVNEQSSMVFVVEFFRHYRQHQDPPRAFGHAQTQLQTLTYANLAQWYRHAMNEVEEFGSDWSWFKSLATNIENNPSQHDNPNPPYADAYHWAGFVLTGQAHL
jgi:CHAT domain-containing protein